MSDALMACERFRGAVDAALSRFEADLAAGAAGRPRPGKAHDRCPFCGSLWPLAAEPETESTRKGSAP